MPVNALTSTTPQTVTSQLYNYIKCPFLTRIYPVFFREFTGGAGTTPSRMKGMLNSWLTIQLMDSSFKAQINYFLFLTCCYIFSIK